MKLLRYALATLAGLLVLLWRLSCRYVVHDPDPRPAWRATGRGYTFGLLHAHQLAAIFINDERRMVAMVSRSADGDFLVPVLRLRRVHAVRGSTRKHGRDKGGGAALAGLCRRVQQGWVGLIAVDGPRGPRNHVQPGAARAALSTGLPILPVVVVPSRRWILGRTWDRFQIPKPFCRIDMYFAPPIQPQAGDDPALLTARLEAALDDLERRFDPREARPITPPASPDP